MLGHSQSVSLVTTWLVRSECKANAWPPLCSALLCHLWSWRGFVYAHVRYGALAFGRLRTAMGFHKRRQSEERRTRPRDSPRQIHPGAPPEMSLLPERGGTYAEACTIGTGFGIPVAQSPQKVRYSLHQNPENPGVLLREMRRSFVCNKMQVCEQYHA